MRGRNAVLMQQKKPCGGSAIGRDSKKTTSKPIMENIFEKVKNNIPILDAVQRYSGVELKKQGRNYVGLCPFHAERTPSFTVSPEKGFFYCFGCGTGGDVITFTAKLYGLRPLDAARKLAQDFGIPLPDGKRPSKETLQQLREIQRKRELERALQKWANEAYLKACTLYRCINRTLQRGGWEAYQKIPKLVHLLPVIENDLNILQFGTPEEKLALFTQRGERWWL